MSLLKAINLFHLYVTLAIYGFSHSLHILHTLSGHVPIYIPTIHVHHLFPSLALEPPLLSITSGSNWLYVEWNVQSATFRVLYRESGAPDYQVIVPTTSQLSHNISALQPNTLYNVVVEATYTVIQQKVNSSVTTAYTTPHGELEGVRTMISIYNLCDYLRMSLIVHGFLHM